MIYSILRRILRKHLLWHLFVPLIAGVGVEVLYTWWFDPDEWSHLYTHSVADNLELNLLAFKADLARPPFRQFHSDWFSRSAKKSGSSVGGSS
jgi:hypothetical protein